MIVKEPPATQGQWSPVLFIEDFAESISLTTKLAVLVLVAGVGRRVGRSTRLKAS